MAEGSLFAQRLHAITERRRLQERILATRRALEEERLRAQRLKRKSLRERWLMEGAPMPADDKDHMSSLWEAESRVQDLEQDLASLQSQMQDLDNMDLPQGHQQQPLKEVKQLDGIVKIDGTSSFSPEKGNPTETNLELDSLSLQKPMEGAAKEDLENGDISADGTAGNECSSEQTGLKVSPVTREGGDFQPHQGTTEAAPTLKNVDPSEAPTAHQRKLAVEKMVIRDHLGQEVGSMDAVGQTQNFIRKEDELRDHDDLGNDCQEWSTSGSLCNVVDQKKIGCATENHLACDLGSRDGPEGASPTSCGQQNPANFLQDSANCLDSPRKQGDSEQVEEAVLMEMEPKELAEQNAEEPAGNLAVSEVATEAAVRKQENPTEKEEMQEGHGSGTIMLGRAEELEETKQCVSNQIAPGQETTIPNLLEEAKLDPGMTPSPLDQVPSLSDIKVSLPEQNPLSFQETQILFLESEQSLLPSQSPSVLSDQSVSLQENKDCLLGQTASPLPESIIASNPSSLQDHFSSPEQKAFPLQEDATLQEGKGFLSDQTPSSIPEAKGENLDHTPTALQECSDSVVDPILPTSPNQLTSLPEKIPSHERPRSPSNLPTGLDQEQSGLEMKSPLPDIPPSVINQLSSLSDPNVPLEEAHHSSLEEVPVPLQVQMPTITETQTLLLSEGDKFPSGQSPLSENEKETSTIGPDHIPLTLQDQKPPFLDGKEVTGSSTDHSPLQNQTSSCLPEPSLKDQAQPTEVEHISGSLQDQSSLLKETEETLPGNASSSPAPNQDQGPTLQETTVLDALSTVSRDSAQPLLDATVNSENRELKEDGDANLASEAETTDLQEYIAAEQQPLLNDLKTALTPQDISLGDQQQSKSGILKHQGASVQEAPIYITTDGNPASCHFQPAASHQEEGQEQGQNKGKQKTCQCCLVM